MYYIKHRLSAKETTKLLLTKLKNKWIAFLEPLKIISNKSELQHLLLKHFKSSLFNSKWTINKAATSVVVRDTQALTPFPRKPLKSLDN